MLKAPRPYPRLVRRFGLLLVLLLIAAGCSSSATIDAAPTSTEPASPTPEIESEPSPTEAEPTPVPDPTTPAASPTATPERVAPEPTETPSQEVVDQDAIEQVLVSYTVAINDRRAEDAYALFTEDLQASIPLDELVDGTSTSFISRLNVAQTNFTDSDTALVIASFRSDQAPELGRDGQACSIWEIQYRMSNVAGDWLIDQATALEGSPFACPVVVPQPEPDDEPDNPDPAPTPTPRLIDSGKPVVHLTLDDGPGPETARFLDLFDEFGIETTFFVNTNRIQGREAVTRRIVESGHAIANHTHTHCNIENPNSLTPFSICGNRTANQEIEEAQQIIENTVGFAPTCFRAPYGAQSAATLRIVESYGLTSWLWDIDTNDWRFNDNNSNYSDAQAIAELNKAATLNPSYRSEGVIILLHDGTASAPRMLRLLRTWLETNADTFEFKVLTGC